MMTAVHEETQGIVERFYPPYDDPPARPPDGLPASGDGRVITAARSGFVSSIDLAALVRAADDARGLLRVDARPGDHVTLGTPLASWWPEDDTGADVTGPVQQAIKLEYEMSGDMIADDERAVRDLADRVRQTLHGDVDRAFADRSGETRST